MRWTQVVYLLCGLLVLIFLTLCNHIAAARSVTGHGSLADAVRAGQAHAAEELERGVAVVRRLDGRGTGSKHFRKRSIPDPSGDVLETGARSSRGHAGVRSDWESVDYELRAFGRTFVLNLTQDSTFISPGFVVQHVGEPEQDAGSEPTDLQHCFYSGRLNSDPESSAVLSVCDGLHGMFSSRGAEYFIQPVREADPDSGPSPDGRHAVHRRSASAQTPPASAQTPPVRCGVKDRTKRHGARTHSSRRLHGDDGSGSHGNARLHGDDEDEEGSGRRRKRYSSRPLHVETMVTADSRMASFHGRDLQHYVLTLMAMAARIYRHPSLQSDINLSVVKLVILNSDRDGPQVTGNAPTTLRNFCSWQHQQNTPDDAHPAHYDTAVLLTRQDLCSSRDVCSTLGLAEVGTMCESHRSCSISQDNGLSAAFTIAHEIGHVFNMQHDSHRSCAAVLAREGRYNLMAPTLNGDSTHPWAWSRCSSRALNDFLRAGRGSCLHDPPTGPGRKLPRDHPGQLFDVDHQCELVFGKGSTLCPFMRGTTCAKLWCTTMVKGQRVCQTYHMPWADGTSCGTNRWCQEGKCTEKREVVRVDGGWGSWEPWGSCSRSCGGGVQSSSRKCDSPAPKNGGDFCRGEAAKHRSCRTEPCPAARGSDGKDTFREEQCGKFDGQHFNINGLNRYTRWVPRYSGVSLKDSCKLTCRVAGTTMFYTLREKVIDGTPCGPEISGVCIQGQCQKTGCDNRLGSTAKRDKCGICGGRGESCSKVSGSYNKVGYGYRTALEIPAGSTRIEIRQLSYNGKKVDGNYLAVRNAKGKYFINGKYVIRMSALDELDIGGAVLSYSGSDTVEEKISIRDRTREKLIIEVISSEYVPPQVKFSYLAPKSSTQFTSQRENTRTRTRMLAPQGPTRPSPNAVRSTWYTGSWGGCSKSCGHGEKRRSVQCLDQYGRTSRGCNAAEKPAETERCYASRCGEWIYGGWSECSKPCGRGQQLRLVGCRLRNGAIGPDRECDMSTRPSDTQDCNTSPCSSRRWYR
ncbi:ADAMTS15 [Branchiostoma lanceolatum]|uniref:ADAMTS15 protein n=1 Tax=Branchiostoma lanceolatum TaxID=7740 RepID=A0A8J9ZCI5_BRALA|nr:ADAMTS15 [Branchiostoma lanceolatum]